MNKYYKDDQPENTVITLLNMLKEKGICPTFSWLESIPGAHSVIVSIPGTTISANGKGSTKNLACASGLAELTERLQNFLHFRLSDAFSFAGQEIWDLIFSSAYSKESLSEKQKNSWFDKIGGSHMSNLKDVILSSDYGKSKIYARYTRTNDSSDDLFIPYAVLDYYYGSNGMAAGNTYIEALVQALSEIIERHVASRLLSEGNLRDDIFDITDAYLVNYPDAYSKFATLRDNGYVIRVLDFSIDGQFPVIGLLAINQCELTYFINLGCHPNIDIAVHRAINEFLQGREINKISDMQPFYTNFSQVNLTKNLENVFHDGAGIFPIACLTSSARSNRLPTIWLRSYSSNEEIASFYEYLICKQLEKEIFVQYQSTLDFPVVHVIVPNFSEVVPILDIDSMRTLLHIQNVKSDYLSFIKNCAWDTSTLSNLIDRFECIPTIPLGDLFRLPISPTVNPLYELSTAHILMCLHVLQGDYKSAYSAALSHLRFLGSSHPRSNHSRYNFVVSVLYMLANEYSLDEAADCLLSLGYPRSIVQEYVRLLAPPAILELFPRITCPNCTDCEFSDLCCFEDECKILLQITHPNEK